MTEKRISLISLICSALAALLLLFWWFSTDPTKNFVENVPGMDQRGERTKLMRQVDIGQHFTEFDGVASDIPGSWPRFRGANYDNINDETIPLSNQWDSPPELFNQSPAALTLNKPQSTVTLLLMVTSPSKSQVPAATVMV